MNSKLNTFENISVAKLKTFVEDDKITILDIRDEQSFQEGHIPDAIHLDNKNIDEVISRLNKHQASYGQKYLHGIGWDQEKWEYENFPDNKKLNEAYPDLPVVLERNDRNFTLANAKALEMADINELTKVEGGKILRRKGKLTGILTDNAIKLLDRIKPEFSRENQIQALIAAQEICFENGLTTVDQGGISKNKILLIDSLQRKKLINIRIYAMIENNFESLDYFFNIGGIKNELLNVNSVEVNVDGVFFMCRSALRHMVNNKSGVIVNFGSIWGNVAGSGVTAYCVSKGAVHQLTKALALEHAEDGIRVNAVAPGEVNTPMIRSGREKPPTVDELQKLADDTIPIKRLAEPEEIAEVVLFLASEKSSYITGSIVPVDAGYTAR